MKLIECYIENFGKICKQKFSFSQGFNCICGENGSGKTTLSMFIKAMLYGIGDTKKLSLAENDRRRYLPWSGGCAGGSLTFSARGKTYRIERSFAAKASDDTFALFDVTTGLPSADFTEALGEELFGIDADGFERTVFLSERTLSPKSDNRSISAKLSDLVGADGDIGVMDNAVKILDEQRKFLYKKGGAGKISETRSQLSETERRLSELDTLERGVTDSEERMSVLRRELETVSERAKELMTERGLAAGIESRGRYEQTYGTIKAELDAMLRRKDALTDFFGGRIPTHSEIEEAALNKTRAQALFSDERLIKESEEYTELRNYFENRTAPEEIERIRAARDSVQKKQERDKDARVIRARELFGKRIPSTDEIDGQIKLLTDSRTGKTAPIIYVILALIFAIGMAGATLVPTPYRYLVMATVGVLTVTVMLMILISRSRSRMARKKSCGEFLLSVMGKEPEEIRWLPTLVEMRSTRDSAIVYLDESEYYRDMQTLTDFLGRFPTEYSADSVLGAVGKILEKYGRYTELTVAEKYKAKDGERVKQEAERLRAVSTAFLASYKTVTADPIGELRSALSEYNALTASIIAKRQELENFASLHKIGEELPRIESTRGVAEIDAERMLLEQKQIELSRELGALQSRSDTDYSSLLERDKLVARREELTESLAKYEENLQIIQLTAKYLEAAKNSLTAKYLGKTKAGFEKYASEIGGGCDGEFEMSTDFGVSKREGGATRPTEAYSRGTRDLYALSARFALTDSLYEGEKPFIILDDPFVNLDDGKIKAAISVLKKFSKERQIIYLTCSESRSK